VDPKNPDTVTLALPAGSLVNVSMRAAHSPLSHGIAIQQSPSGLLVDLNSTAIVCTSVGISALEPLHELDCGSATGAATHRALKDAPPFWDPPDPAPPHAATASHMHTAAADPNRAMATRAAPPRER
jgi:hypothetical protein